MSTVAKLDKQIKALRAELRPVREAVTVEPDDISQYDFTSVRPKKGDSSPRTPPGRRVPAPRRKSSARTPRSITQPMQAYIDTLPRGERAKAKRAMTAYRNFGNMDPADAIARYKQRRRDDVRDSGIDNAGDFEDIGDSDMEIDSDESDDEQGGGALTDAMQRLHDDPNWMAANADLGQRLAARATMTRGQEIAARAADVGPDQERAERDQLATAVNTHGQAPDVWARLAAATDDLDFVSGSESDSDDEERRDSIQPFTSPTAAPTGAQQWAAQNLPGVNLQEDETHAWVGENPQYFGDQPPAEQTGTGERAHTSHAIV